MFMTSPCQPLLVQTESNQILQRRRPPHPLSPEALLFIIGS